MRVMEELVLVLLRAQAAALLTEKPRADVSRQRSDLGTHSETRKEALNALLAEAAAL